MTGNLNSLMAVDPNYGRVTRRTTTGNTGGKFRVDGFKAAGCLVILACLSYPLKWSPHDAGIHKLLYKPLKIVLGITDFADRRNLV
jgi:hypothetical protein